MPAPGQFFPRTSSRHRAACRALYRALLKPCVRIPLPSGFRSRGPVNPLRFLIRKRFRQNVIVDSPHIIRKGLKIGYLAEHLIRLAANGVKSAIDQTHTFLLSVEADAEAARRTCIQPKPDPPKRQRVWRFPGAPRILDARPLALKNISSGRRHVPSLVLTSCGFPFLRFKRPQSPYLSRVIRDRVFQKQRSLDQSDLMQDIEELGKTEDIWEDKVLGEINRSVEGGIEEGGASEWWTEGWGKNLGEDDPSWTEDTWKARKRIDDNMRADRMRIKMFGEKLFKIREEEKRLMHLERADRVKKKRTERLIRRQEGRTVEQKDGF